MEINIMRNILTALIGIALVITPMTVVQADLIGVRNKQVETLRVVELGSRHGHPSDQLDAEVIVHLKGHDGDFGFQLRVDKNQPVREAMFELLNDAFTHDWNVSLDYEISPPKKNGVIIRVWVSKR